MTPAYAPEGYDRIPPLDLLGMAKVVWYGKWVVALATAVMVGLGTYYAFHMTGPLYAATATLQVERQAPTIGGITGQNRTDLVGLNTQVSHLTSDTILRAVITDLELLQDPEFNRYLTPASALSPDQIRATLRNLLAGTHAAPPTRQEILQKTIENLRGRLSAKRPDETYLFEITARSHNADKAIQIANVTSQSFMSAQLRARNTEAAATVDWLNNRVATLRAQLSRQDRAMIDLSQTVQVHEDTALDRLGTAVLARDQEHATLQSTLAKIEADTAPPTARRTAEVQQLTSRISDTQAHRDRLQHQLSTQSAGMLALQQMQREADTTRALHQSFHARLQEAKIQNALTQPDSRIVTPAAIGTYVGARKTLIVNISAIVGFLLGLFAVAMQHMMRTGVYHPLQLAQETGGAVLGQIPARLTRRPTAFLEQLQEMKNSNLSTALRKIRTGLIVQNAGICPKVIMVTASGKDEGAVPLAIGLAHVLNTSQEQCTLVIAAPSSREVLKYLPPMQGSSETLANHLTCEVLFLNEPEYILTEDFRLQLRALRETSAHIVILAPPVINTPETLLCAREADAIVYAARWATRPAGTIQKGLQLLKEAHKAPIGLVLTQTQTRKMRRMAAISGLPAAEMSAS